MSVENPQQHEGNGPVTPEPLPSVSLSRRKFLELGAVATAGLVLSACSPAEGVPTVEATVVVPPAEATVPPVGVLLQESTDRIYPLGVSAPLHEAPAEYIDTYLDAAAEGGFGFIKFDMEANGFDENQAKYEEVVIKAKKRGIKPVPVLAQWAADGFSGDHYRDTMTAEQYEAFAGKVARTFVGVNAEGDDKQVDHYLLGTEPNHEKFWPGGPNVQEYAAHVRAASPAIKKANPHATIISAGLKPMSMKKMRDWVDGMPLADIHRLGYNAYSQPRPFDSQMVRAVHQTLTDRGFENPLWIPEIGWPTSKGHAEDTTREDQAMFSLAAAEFVIDHPTIAEVVIFHRLTDYRGADRAKPEEVFGLMSHLREDDKVLIPKPSFTRLQKLNEEFRAEHPQTP